jgi:hypothetical protein
MDNIKNTFTIKDLEHFNQYKVPHKEASNNFRVVTVIKGFLYAI